MFLSPFSELSERKKMQDIIGILFIFTGAASGLLFQDPVVCRFKESNQCYVGRGRRLHLQMPLEDGFNLKINTTSSSSSIIIYRKHQSNKSPNPAKPQWQFVHDNKTMILSSAGRNDSGTYTLEIIYADGVIKGYTLQVYTEAEVSSVKVWYSCLSSGVMTVNCSADGDNLRFNWTSDLNTLSQPENGNNTLILDKNHHGNVICHVENHISRGSSTVGPLQPCPESTTAASTTGSSAHSPTTNLGTKSTVSYYETYSSNQIHSTSISNNNSWFLKHTLIILSSICAFLILSSTLAFYIFKKKQGQKNNEAPSQDGRELVYTQVNHLSRGSTKTRPRTSQVQDKEMEYAMVVNHATERKQEKQGDEVQYGELVFNTPARRKHQSAPEVQEECVYSEVKRGR